ncbi:MAG TPA: hypothetical protein DD435_05450 [Cyanobacteria bacterium UBA8530]|nr:hypothetical protein [Cyanobacteria bacterium UBA8530]
MKKMSMKKVSIRAQNFLLILPLFLGLAVFNGLFGYITERQALERGLHEESLSLVRTCAEFAGSEEISDLHLPVARILKRGQARRVFVFTPEGKLLFDEGNKGVKHHVWSKEILSALQRDGFRLKPIKEIHQLAFVSIYAPMRQGRWILGMEVDTTPYRDRLKPLLLKNVLIGLLSLLSGILLSLFLSAFITRPLRQVSLATALIAKGNFEPNLSVRAIQELDDLGHSFNVMASVMKEAQAKNQRVLIENELFRSQADLAKEYEKHFWAPIQADEAGVSFSAGLLGPRAEGSFFGFCPGTKSLCFVVGRISGKGEMGLMLGASAAFELIRRGLVQGDPVSTFREVSALFPLSHWQCLQWTSTGQARLFCKESEEKSVDLASPLALHNLGKEKDLFIESYLERFGGFAVEDLSRDLRTILGGETSGCLCLFGRSEK